jgi:outer membrane lipopolysaccharide assembly protein LptE/RlpB
MIFRRTGSLLVLLAALVLSGCAYHLGATNGMAEGARTIEVQPFSNKTLEPRLGDAVTSAVRRTLQSDGTYKLATTDAGDIVVTGVLTKYERREISFLPEDVLTARDYRILLTAQVTARDRSTGKVILNKPISGTTLIRVGTDLTSTERQALPLLANDLAKNVTESLADSTW